MTKVAELGLDTLKKDKREISADDLKKIIPDISEDDLRKFFFVSPIILIFKILVLLSNGPCQIFAMTKGETGEKSIELAQEIINAGLEGLKVRFFIMIILSQIHSESVKVNISDHIL